MGYCKGSYEEKLVNKAEQFFSKDDLYNQLLMALSSDEIKENLEFIFRMNDVSCPAGGEE